MLQSTALRAYAVRTGQQWPVGNSSPVERRTAAPSVRGFFVQHGKLYGRAMREGASPAGTFPGLLTRMCPSTHLAVGRRVNTAERSNAMSSNTPAIRPHVEIVNGQPLTSSIKIAEHFGKNHKDVLRAIEQLDCSPAFRERNFEPTSASVPMPNGGHRHIPAYTITRDGFTFLAMGFTGKEAAQWKEAYIEAFNRMETELISNTHKLPFLTAGKPGQRYLLTFNNGGSYHVSPIDYNACIMFPAQFANAVREPGNLCIADSTLLLLIANCTARLQGRHAFNAPWGSFK